MPNLLVVDWDYFFYNPLEAGVIDTETLDLYDWGHAENNLCRELIWSMRATNFMLYEKELPTCVVPDGWWDRFTFTSDAICEVSDSNMYSGMVNGSETYDHVWLFDAHHDLYTIKTEDDLAKWYDRSKISCEDWMFAHHLRGSKLHWRWPRWHRYNKGVHYNIPRFVRCDARRDDMCRLDSTHMQFDAVSICRSGAWVPPWCDQQFEKFYRSVPVSEIVQVDDFDLVRHWDNDAVRAEYETRVKVEEMVNKAPSSLLH